MVKSQEYKVLPLKDVTMLLIILCIIYIALPESECHFLKTITSYSWPSLLISRCFGQKHTSLFIVLLRFFLKKWQILKKLYLYLFSLWAQRTEGNIIENLCFLLDNNISIRQLEGCPQWSTEKQRFPQISTIIWFIFHHIFLKVCDLCKLKFLLENRKRK